ncbi:MAG: hypothetical protein KJ558_05190 [Gammaproteobacteria bacterium]|nr:hypothetical protein [Gammaproteobacteria bacterium]MBU1654210.1 hypothetical protein [Gammaproteobacteria bacterium]MBU1960870.1 hypothetical protein [Gammaproteobacteria bacterium]
MNPKKTNRKGRKEREEGQVITFACPSVSLAGGKMQAIQGDFFVFLCVLCG